MDIKELATLTAAEMDDIYLRNVPAIILEQYATRLIAAYTEGQEPVVRVVDGGGELHLPKLQWVSANHSLETPIGSKLFAAPPETAADYRDKWMAAQAREAKLREEMLAVAYDENGYLINPDLADAAELPADDSALMERLKEERERCAVRCEQFNGQRLADAIRSMT